MQERLAHSDKLYRVKVPVNSLVALECGRILGAARRPLWTNVLNRSRNVAALGEIPRSFRSLAPPQPAPRFEPKEQIPLYRRRSRHPLPP
jgi:hypothetical protein